jgi:outer membrane receptor protein involved in Fe transport
LLLLFSTGAAAQINTATIVGSISDQTDALVPGATVTVSNVATQAERTAETDAAGNYSIELLPPGEYDLAVESPGFKRTEQSGIRLFASDRPKIDLVLEVGEVTESVTVTEAVSLVQTQKSEGGVVIQNKQVLEMPLNGRNFSQLIELEPGVVYSRGGVYFHGLTRDGVNITVDGTDASHPDRPSTNFTGNFGGQAQMNILSIEFIEEFKTTVGVFSAEIGRAASGGLNVITKSGTNDPHGSLFYFMRNDKLDAKNYFARRKDPNKINQFGLAIGGPIVKNKVFFFGGWESARVRRGRQLEGPVPTQRMRELMLQATPEYGHTFQGSDGTAPSMLDLLPLPNVPNSETQGGLLARHRRSGTNMEDQDSALAKFDFHPTPNDMLFLRYTIMDAEVFLPDISPLNGTNYPPQEQNGTFSWTHLFGASMMNEFRYGFHKQNMPRRQEAFFQDAQGPGRIQGPFNHDRQELLQSNGGSLSALNNFSITKGSHALKMGFENRRFHYGRRNFENPHYRFTSVDNIINGSWESVFITIGNPLRRYQESQWGIYIQDDWRVTPNLTLNLGVRYEYYTPPIEARGNHLYNVIDSPFGAYAPMGTPPWDPDSNNWGPRFGLAWDIGGDSKTVLRMGGGVFYSPNTYREVTILGNPPELPYDLTIFKATTPSYLVDFPINVVAPGFDISVLGPPSRQTFDRSQRTTYSEQWSVNLQRQIATDLVVEAGYVGNRGLKLLATKFHNEIIPELGAQLRPDPSIGRISYQQHSGNSNYHAMEVSLKKRFSKGFTFNGHYTWSHGIVYSGIDAVTAFGNRTIQDQNNWRGSRGRTGTDIRHNFTLNGAWELQADRKLGLTSGFGKKFLEGWQFNWIVSLRTGMPIRTIASGRDTRGNNDSGVQRVDYVGGEGRFSNYRSSLQLLNPSAFANPCLNAGFASDSRCGLFGNFGANVFSAPGQQVFDLSLFKTTTIKENLRLQFRAEFFNAFNRANFRSPSGSRLRLTSGAFGRITSAQDPRQIQFALKILF